MRLAAVPVRGARRFKDLITTPVARVIALAEGARIGKGLRCVGLPLIARARDSQIHVGQRVLLCSASRGNALGINHPVVLRTWLPGARLTIGDDVGISGATICAAGTIEIGAGSLIGANAVIVDNDFHPSRGEDRRYADNPMPAPSDRIWIGSNVFVGTAAIILKGTTIGDGATIGAGAVVSGQIPAGALVVGNPGRVVREGDGATP